MQKVSLRRWQRRSVPGEVLEVTGCSVKLHVKTSERQKELLSEDVLPRPAEPRAVLLFVFTLLLLLRAQTQTSAAAAGLRDEGWAGSGSAASGMKGET